MKSTRRRHIARYALITLAALFTGLSATAGMAQEHPFIVVQSTTSTQNSGLFDYMLPRFTKKTGIDVRIVAVGTGQAIKNARNGDGDVLLVHDRRGEDKFVAEGWGVGRRDVMYNDFVIVGPKSDPAGIAGGNKAAAALRQIAEKQAPFASRGDDSGTNRMEKRLWQSAGIAASDASGGWYRETGQGMGATLNVAVGMGAYTLTDRATWLKFKNKRNFTVLVEGDPTLFNPYGVILVNPAKHPRVKAELGQKFIDWLVSGEGQRVIGDYKIGGRQAFFPSAKK